MYLHLGNHNLVKQKDIVGIFDLDNVSWSFLTREYLYKAEQQQKVRNLSDDIPKSLVVCMEEEKEVLYLSQLSSQTLLKRSEENTALAEAVLDSTASSS